MGLLGPGSGYWDQAITTHNVVLVHQDIFICLFKRLFCNALVLNALFLMNVQHTSTLSQWTFR